MGVLDASVGDVQLPGLLGVEVGGAFTAESQDVALVVEDLLLQVEELLAVGGDQVRIDELMAEIADLRGR